MDINHDLIYYNKVLIFGEEGSGKSSLSNRLKTGEFSNKILPTKDG